MHFYHTSVYWDYWLTSSTRWTGLMIYFSTFQVVIFNVEMPIIKGFSVILHYQAMSEQAHFKKLVKELNRVTGEVIREKPRFVKLSSNAMIDPIDSIAYSYIYTIHFHCRCLPKNSSGVVIIKVARPICLELYQDSKELGRITIRQAGHTIAAGIVTALLWFISFWKE